MGSVLTTTRRALPALALAGVSLALCGQSLAVGFGPTHMVTLKVTASDHWTRTADLGCAPVGDGTVTFTETWRRPARAFPELDSAGRRWVLLVLGPGGHSALDLGPQRATGQITYANNVTIGGSDGCTGSVDTRGCRTYAVDGATNVFGIDRRSMRVLSSLRVGQQIRPRGSCLAGAYTSLNDLNFFNRDLSIRMPSPAAVRTRHKLVLTGSDSGHLRDFALADGSTVDETVTQTAVLTLTRIARS
jgi:hypothetical protein